MGLINPDKHDIQKIHAEIIQIVNQRIVLTTLAVTVFGVMVAVLIPKEAPIQPTTMGNFVNIGSLLLTVVIFIIFLLIHHLSHMLRVFTAYLDVTGSSNWEKDWNSYRKEYSYLGYTKPITIVFLLLGVVSSGFPVFLWTVYPYTLTLNVALIGLGIAGAFYLILVAGMGFAGWFANEKKIRGRWETLKKSKNG